MIKNRTLFTGDNLPILRGMEDSSVDLIYLDPPFNSNANYAAPIGSDAAGAEFKDTWGLSDIDIAWYGEIAENHQGLYDLLTAVKTINGNSMMSYLIYMAVRVMELHRVLKDTGSLYLHCDPTASHYLKLLLDEVFGKKGFRREIIWDRKNASGGKAAANNWIHTHDIILYYSKHAKQFTFNKIYEPYSKEYIEKRFVHEDNKGRYRIQPQNRKQYLAESKGVAITSVWDIRGINVMAKEKIGYPTQKPLSVLNRLIKASSNEGDMVLDPFCGCATACVASEILGRKWIGIDISVKAVELVKMRLRREVAIGDKDNPMLLVAEVIHRTDIPDDRKGRLSKDIKHLLYGKQDGKCIYCYVRFPFRNLTKDHIVARSMGGTDTDDNLQLLCGSCNSQKGTMAHEEYLSYRKNII